MLRSICRMWWSGPGWHAYILPVDSRFELWINSISLLTQLPKAQPSKIRDAVKIWNRVLAGCSSTATITVPCFWYSSLWFHICCSAYHLWSQLCCINVKCVTKECPPAQDFSPSTSSDQGLGNSSQCSLRMSWSDLGLALSIRNYCQLYAGVFNVEYFMFLIS